MHPSVIRMPPPRRKSIIPKSGASTRQCEIHQGTKPATNPGAMTRKTAEPSIANTFLIMSPGISVLASRLWTVYSNRLDCDPGFGNASPEALPAPLKLGDIPFLGNLFKTTTNINNKTELLIFITPKILREGSNLY